MKSIKRIAAALALTGAMAASAVAAPVTYGVDGTHTFPRFSYSHFGYSTQLSSFSKTTGTVVFDAEAKKGSVDIVIDLKSVSTGFADFNEHICCGRTCDLWRGRHTHLPTFLVLTLWVLHAVEQL